MVSQRRLDLVESWEGNNIFLCGGRLMLGPDTTALAATVLLLTTPTAVFMGVVGVELGNRISWAFESVAALGYILVMWALLLTATSDPGIIPREYEPADPELASRGTNPMTKEHIVNGRVVKTKYCLTCSTYRPPRCSHCRVCDNCVEKFDHHCPWVGTCIGKGNYRYFILFISGASIMDIFLFASSLTRIFLVSRDESISVFKALRYQAVATGLAFYCFVFFWFVGGLCLFHVYLILSNKTTYEHFKSSSSGPSLNPYDMGAVENCRQALCVPYQSLLDLPVIRTQNSHQSDSSATADIGSIAMSRRTTDTLEAPQDKDSWISPVSTRPAVLSPTPSNLSSIAPPGIVS